MVAYIRCVLPLPLLPHRSGGFTVVGAAAKAAHLSTAFLGTHETS
jgi:hypothetical protein